VPFTVSHIAAVLPLRRSRLPLSALAMGSMSPDLPYFVPGLVGFGAEGGLTHSLLGIVTVDLLFGALMWALWLAMAPALRDLVPDVVRARWPDSRVRPGPIAVMAALMIGGLTHVLWDEFTHVDRFGHRTFGVLAATYPSPVGEIPGYRWLQYASGLLGLTAIAWTAWRRPRRSLTPRSYPTLARAFPWLGLVGAGLGVLARSPALAAADQPRTVAFLTVSGAISGAVAAAAAACLAWHLRQRRRSGIRLHR
jgi:membrane-bound metal-dependent hydrolase YbcI (DUF457 family)